MNWTVIIIIGVVVLALLVFINIRNKKDKKEAINQIEQDYPKPQHENQGDADGNEPMK